MSSHAARRTLDRDGIEVDLYRYDTDEPTPRGTPKELSADSPISLQAIPDPDGKSVAYGVFGVEVDADMVYLVHEDLDIEDGGDDTASVIVQNGRSYRVDDADRTQRHGFAILECRWDQEVDLP